MGISRYRHGFALFMITTILYTYTNAIYVPNMSGPIKTKSTLVNSGKQMEWQNPETTTEGFQVYQNYANVKIQRHENADNLKQIYEQNNAQDPDAIPYQNINNVAQSNNTRNKFITHGNITGHYIVRNTTSINRFESTTIRNEDNDFAASSYNPYGDGNFKPVENPTSNWNYPQGQNQPNWNQNQPNSTPTDDHIQFNCTLNCRRVPQNNFPPQGNPTNGYGPIPFNPQHQRPPVIYLPPPPQTNRPYRPINSNTNFGQGRQYPLQPTQNLQPSPSAPRPQPSYTNPSYNPPVSRYPQTYPQNPTSIYSQNPSSVYPQNPSSVYSQNPSSIYSQNPSSINPQTPPSYNTHRQVPLTVDYYYSYQHPKLIIPQNYHSGKLQALPQQTQPRNKCPPGATGQFPHENSCNKFLNCWNGRGILQNCAPGTLFNPITLECDFPSKVNCISGPRTPKFERLTVTEVAFCPKEFSGMIPHYQNCSKFLQCNNGQQIERDCPPGTLFDVNTNICDHSYKVQCANGERQGRHYQNYQTHQQLISPPNNGPNRWSNNNNFEPPPSRQNYQTTNQQQNQNSFRPNGQVKCPEYFSGLMPHPYDCAKFLNCDNGRTHIMDCGPGTHFNPAINTCDHIYNVKCYNGQSQNQQFQQQNNNKQPPYPDYQTGLLPPNGQNFHPPQGQVQESPSNNYEWIQPGQQKIINEETVQVTTVAYERLTAAPTENKRKPWPPPFPTNNFDNDYIIEYEDLIPEADIPEQPNVTENKVVLINTGCKPNDFQCGNKFCIGPSLVCNGNRDCPNGKDELDCDIRLKDFLKTAGTKLAVLETNKLSNITLAWCAAICANSNCKGFNYRKHDGTCYILDKNVGLSGALIILPMYDYYENKVYSVGCNQNENYLCQNQKCIPKNKLCNGINDCGDGLDEKGCTADAFDYKIRLVGGPNSHSGHIELQVFGKRGYICDDVFGLRDADVACRELGFPLGAVEVRGNSEFAQEVTDIETNYLMDDVSCIGNETSLRDCDFSGWGKSNCNTQEIVGVVCKVPMEICPKDYWKCENNLECLPLAYVCDGVYDCADKSDEQMDMCDAPTKIRLTQNTKGRLEILHHGVWGTVCDDDFNDDAAKVVCSQLGFNGSAKVVKDGQFGAGSGPIWLDQVYCKGNESALDNCVHWDWGEHNCEHSEDVGVVCNTFIGTSRNSQTKTNYAKQKKAEEVTLPQVCGLRSDAIFDNLEIGPEDAHFRVVDASTARIGEYPWQASIRVKGKTKAAHWCGAVVISSKYVLTAAHCLTGYSKGAYFIVAGDYNVDKDEGIEQEVYIEDFIKHPQFGQGNKMNNDIALVRLKGNGFNITKHVQPICLPPEGYNYPVGLNCTISGFGSIESGKSKASRDLRAGWIPILSDEVCKMPHIYGTAITPGMLCAGFLENGIDACDGDSGGPLACLHEGVFKLFGITSWGQHCGYANKPGVYVNVAQYRKWIEDTMKEFLK